MTHTRLFLLSYAVGLVLLLPALNGLFFLLACIAAIIGAPL